MSEVILVIGGRIKIGSAVIEQLVTKGEAVRALVSSGEGAASFPDRVEGRPARSLEQLLTEALP